METLASILTGAGANPYQTAGSGGISPLLMQMMLAQQMGPSQLGQGSGTVPNSLMPQAQSASPPPNAPQPVQGQPALPMGFGTMGSVMPSLIPGIY
jgi:hypothetical protein